MFDDVDRAYVGQRAGQARGHERSATDPAMAVIHRHFAEAYGRKVTAGDPTRPPPAG